MKLFPVSRTDVLVIVSILFADMWKAAPSSTKLVQLDLVFRSARTLIKILKSGEPNVERTTAVSNWTRKEILSNVTQNFPTNK